MAFIPYATRKWTQRRFSASRTTPLQGCRSGRDRIWAACSVGLVDSLSEALQRGHVKEFGDRISLDSNGFLPQCSSPIVPPEHVNILENVAASVRASLARSSVRAIFARGSTVSGNLLGDFRSDLDLIVFTEVKVNSEEKKRLRDILLSQLRNSLRIGSIDIQYLHMGERRGSNQLFRLSSTLQIILRYFATPIYGAKEDIGVTDGPIQPRPQLALDMANDIIAFKSAMQVEAVHGCFSLQLSVIQWLCKKCLRAVAELAAPKVGAYARDLLPCYELGSEAYPTFADTILHGLLIACASPSNRYLDLRKGDLLRTGTSIALQFAEIVEELFIRQYFGSGAVTVKEVAVSSSGVVTPPARWFSNIYEIMKEGLFNNIFLFTRQISLDDKDFRRRPLPELELNVSKFVEVRTVNSKMGTTCNTTDAHSNFTNIAEPVVFRNLQKDKGDGGAVTRQILTCLLRCAPTVQCRVARGRNVTFCRSGHEWIDDNIFTPPSVLISLPVPEAVQRLCECHGLPNVIYDDCDDECVYIQSKTVPSLRVFDTSESQKWDVVQEERLWISSHGTVSTLHYDASYSALYQRCGRKRILFFPPDCLPELGIYPLGHPLHRRGRIDLTRKDTIVFDTFWKECPSKARDVTLHPGDLLIFPPFWSHYTETVTGSSKELSISHTLRYVIP